MEELDMLKDRSISLPDSTDWYTTFDERKDGKDISYSIRFTNMRYTVGDGPARIRGTATVKKEMGLPDWVGLPLRPIIWKFTDTSCGLSDGHYKSDLASKALKRGVILDQQFFAEVCREAEAHLAGLRRRIDDTYSSRPHLAKTA